MKIVGDFYYKWKPYHQIKLFTVSKDEWDTKEGPGKSMKNALYVHRYGKRHFCTEAMLNNEKNQAYIALTIAKLH